MGVVERTMYRDDRWRFLQIGRCIERFQLAVSLLLAHFEGVATAEETSDHDWMSLLRISNALDACTHHHGVAISAERVVDLLVVDPGCRDRCTALRTRRPASSRRWRRGRDRSARPRVSRPG